MRQARMLTRTGDATLLYGKGEAHMFIGIDVATAGLVVVSILPSAERFTVANDERGVRTLVEPWRNARRRPTSPHLTQDRSAVQSDRCAATFV
jgi:hypothetical protein